MPFIETPQSSNIAGVEYFPAMKELLVVFSGTSAKLYLYSDVEKDEVDALLTAKSLGAHFARSIRGRKFALITTEQLADKRREAADGEPYTPPAHPTPGGDPAQA